MRILSPEKSFQYVLVALEICICFTFLNEITQTHLNRHREQDYRKLHSEKIGGLNFSHKYDISFHEIISPEVSRKFDASKETQRWRGNIFTMKNLECHELMTSFRAHINVPKKKIIIIIIVTTDGENVLECIVANTSLKQKVSEYSSRYENDLARST